MDPFASKEVIRTLAIVAVAFAAYCAGACPTVYVGDSGELVTAVDVLGIPHPTGYPLYVLLGKLWTATVPSGSIAWRMSLFSAAAGALTCALTYRLARLAGLTATASAVGALALAFSASFWGEANVQRVYTLGALFVAGTTIAAWRWHSSRRPLWLYAAFFLCGLGATNHTFMAVYAVALAASAIIYEPKLLTHPRRAVAIAGAFGVGVLPYVYLPLRSAQNPPLDWGNPETLSAFLDVVSRRDFWNRAWVESPADVVVVLLDHLRSFATEFSWAGAVLLVTGVVVARMRRWPLLLLCLIMAGNVAVLALHGSRADIFIWHRYYIPSYVIAALFIAAAADRLAHSIPAQARGLLLLLPLFLLVSNWRENDRSGYRIADAYARGVLQSLPPGAHLAARDDNILFSLIYLTMVEKLRPDVHLILQGVGSAELPPLHFDAIEERLFLTHHPNWDLPQLEIVPLGLVFEARRPSASLPLPKIPFDTLPGEDDPSVPKDYLTENLIGDFHYMLGFTYAQRDWPRARRELERAAASAPNNAVLFYNLGLLYRRFGFLREALAAFSRAHELEPRRLATRSRPRAADRVAEIERELSMQPRAR